MFRDLQNGRRRGGTGLVMALVLLCVSLLLVAGTAQASHGHDAGLVRHGQKAVLLAPAQDCAWCAATQAAMAAQVELEAGPLPWSEPLPMEMADGLRRAPCGEAMFGRPPPARGELRAAGGQDAAGPELRRATPV